MSDRRARLFARAEPALSDGPLVLGVESAGLHLGLALCQLGGAAGSAATEFSLLEEVHSHLGRRHAESFLDLLDAMLSRQEIEPTQLALVACGRGPGSFTGVRVGLASAAGLALGIGCPLWPVDSLAALARNAAGQGTVAIPTVDARKSEVYAAAYRVPLDGPPIEIAPARVGPADRVVAELRELAGDSAALVFGSGAQLYGCASAVPPAWHLPRASELAWLAAQAFDAAGRDPARAPALDPAYVRPSDAELGA
ncbi:MAG: tRNA (adenosine(37)-N6)-threonylcarbamoyltransferase complex dimerization subunit type 1 TsaB [Myxococcota bacterium]